MSEFQTFTFGELESADNAQLLAVASDLGVSVDGYFSTPTDHPKADWFNEDDRRALIRAILRQDALNKGLQWTRGIVDLAGALGELGFVRPRVLRDDEQDCYLSPDQIRTVGLRRGDMVEGPSRDPAIHAGEQHRSLLRVAVVNDRNPEHAIRRPRVNQLEVESPYEWLNVEVPRPHLVAMLKDLDLITGDLRIGWTDTRIDWAETALRVVDLVAPFGRGQRGTMEALPESGKTTLWHQMATGLVHNHPDVRIYGVLVGERPEEVTKVKRFLPWVRIFSATFQQPVKDQKALADLAFEHLARMVESGEHVFVFLDSMTRYVRATNQCVPGSGRTLSGGLDPEALWWGQQLLGRATCVAPDPATGYPGGSLGMLVVILRNPNDRLAMSIANELHGTGNWHVVFNPECVQQLLFPAVHVGQSSTRDTEVFLGEVRYQAHRRFWQELRYRVAGREADRVAARNYQEDLLNVLGQFPTNAHLLHKKYGLPLSAAETARLEAIAKAV